MVLLSAKRFCDLIATGETPDEAAKAVLAEIETLSAASAGLIALDAAGHMVVLWDTPFMAFARRTSAK